MLNLTRQPYGDSTYRRQIRLTAEIAATLERLAPTGLQASAIALAVQLLDVAVNSEPARADELGEVLAVACGWETTRLEEGLELVRCAVQRAARKQDEAMGET